MFDSLTLEQINDIQSEVPAIKYFITEKVSEPPSVSSLVEMTLCTYITQLKTKKQVYNKDVEMATKVTTMFSMDDKAFLDLKKRFNGDYQKIGTLYGSNATYAKLRYQLLLKKRILKLENLDLDKTVDDICEQITMKKKI